MLRGESAATIPLLRADAYLDLERAFLKRTIELHSLTYSAAAHPGGSERPHATKSIEMADDGQTSNPSHAVEPITAS